MISLYLTILGVCTILIFYLLWRTVVKYLVKYHEYLNLQHVAYTTVDFFWRPLIVLIGLGMIMGRLMFIVGHWNTMYSSIRWSIYPFVVKDGIREWFVFFPYKYFAFKEGIEFWIIFVVVALGFNILLIRWWVKTARLEVAQAFKLDLFRLLRSVFFLFNLFIALLWWVTMMFWL